MKSVTSFCASGLSRSSATWVALSPLSSAASQAILMCCRSKVFMLLILPPAMLWRFANSGLLFTDELYLQYAARFFVAQANGAFVALTNLRDLIPFPGPKHTQHHNHAIQRIVQHIQYAQAFLARV